MDCFVVKGSLFHLWAVSNDGKNTTGDASSTNGLSLRERVGLNPCTWCSDECFYFFLSHLTLTYESLKHEKAPNSSDEPVLCLQLGKERIWNGFFKHFVTSSLLQKYIIHQMATNLMEWWIQVWNLWFKSWSIYQYIYRERVGTIVSFYSHV